MFFSVEIHLRFFLEDCIKRFNDTLSWFLDQNGKISLDLLTIVYRQAKAKKVIKVIKDRLKETLADEEVYRRASFFQTSFR